MNNFSTRAGWYDRNCRDCPRLSTFLDDVKRKNPDYFCRPVPPFGDPQAQLLIVGLAPGLKGANATGRPFTGDHAGILLYQTLYKFGFASTPESISADDDLQLQNCRITNAVKCLPPQNKPIGSEVNNCRKFLLKEIDDLPTGGVILALGSIAHTTILRSLQLPVKNYPFRHTGVFPLHSDLQLLSSYHCSRYNTQTKRLTTPMFEKVFEIARNLLNHA